MKILARIVKPDVHAGLIEIYEMELEEGKVMIFPVAIDRNFVPILKKCRGVLGAQKP